MTASPQPSPSAAIEPAVEIVDRPTAWRRGGGENGGRSSSGARTSRRARTSVHVIEPWRPGPIARLQELWRDRRLLPYYGRRYLQRRYMNTWLGWLWLPMRPGLDMLAKSLFFGGFLQVSSGDRPYIIFFTFGTCGWILFESLSSWGARAIRVSDRFISNAYAPRLPRIVGLLWSAALDFFLYVAVALGAVAYFLVTKGVMYLVPSRQVVIAFFGLLLLAAWGLAVALWTSPLSAYTRDIRMSLGYITQFWYFVTPIAYPISSIPAQYQAIALYNPLTAPVEMVKYGFLQTAPPATASYVACFVGLALLGGVGLWMFSRFERAAVERA